MAKKVLLAGESWSSHTTHVKGFDTFYTSVYEEGGKWLIEALENFGYEFTDPLSLQRSATELLRKTGELSQEEIDYLRENYPASNTAKTLEPGMCQLSPYLTLCYARMRKVGHGDYERTERQRIVITKMIEKLKDMNILKIHSMFTEILPMITTDMTNKEITNYALEFIPMLKDLKIQGQRLPYDDNQGNLYVEIDGRPDNQLTIPDLPAAARRMQEFIGMIEPTQPTEAAN